ncbi:MAG TPA: alkaline phosphatase family protein [Actinoplanes sp.]
MTVPDDSLPDSAFAVTRPRYGEASLADLLPSVSAVLGVPGADDLLGLRGVLGDVRRIAVLLVDGLGAYQLPLIARHAPALTGLTAMNGGLTSGFPSTTPVSLVTLGTGARPGAHGILGFTVRRPDGGILNHIRWWDDPDPRCWQPVPTRFESAAAAGVAVTVVNRPEYAGSGLSESANRGATFAGARDTDALAAEMLRALRAATGPALVYGYHPDLDHSGHDEGVDSDTWRAAARGVDQLLEHLVTGLPAGTALLVTADHGQLNVPYDARFDLDTDPVLRSGVVGVSGEPRVRYLHTAAGAHEDVLAAYRSVLGDAAWVAARDEVIAGGWYGPVPPGHLDRIGDVVIVCLGRTVVLASGAEPPAVSRLVAFHGSVTAAEMAVPLLSFVGPGR